MIRRLLALAGAAVLLASCGGGGGGGSTATTTPTPAPPPVAALSNLTPITVDAGPAALMAGANGYSSDNIAFVSIKLCAPGSATNCQTIDHVQVDTGSVGLRIEASVLNASLTSALPTQTGPNGNPVGECYGYVDGYAFGSVRQADFSIGGESVANMPLQVIADGGVFATVPSQCSSGGGSNLNSVQAFGANGILGIGVTGTDCGSYCTTAGGYSAAIYYDCPNSGCSAIIARAASTAAPFQQLPNPVAAFPVDNNGTIVSLPAVAYPGAVSLTGTLYFGIGTQTNNALGSATVLATTTSTSANGEGLITAVYNGQTLADSYIDSGSDEYFFVDSAITPCTGSYLGYYCPASPLGISLMLDGQNGTSTTVNLTLNNAQALFSGANGSNNVDPGLGGNPNAFTTAKLHPYPNSFALGLPFFYGRNVYTAIEGRSAGGTVGPYFAF